jgi:hypothetical protein
MHEVEVVLQKAAPVSLPLLSFPATVKISQRRRYKHVGEQL